MTHAKNNNIKGGYKMSFNILRDTSSNDPSMAEILADAANASNAASAAVNGVANMGMNMFNTMNSMVNPQPMMGQYGQNPYQANMGTIAQPIYAYAETNMRYGMPSYLNTMNPQMLQGYPGFADAEYGMIQPASGFGFGGL